MTTFYWAIKFFFIYKKFQFNIFVKLKVLFRHWEHFILNNEEKKIKCFLPSLSYGSLNSNKNARLSNASAVLCVSESRYESSERQKKETFFVLPFYRRFCNSFFSLHKIMLYAHDMIVYLSHSFMFWFKKCWILRWNIFNLLNHHQPTYPLISLNLISQKPFWAVT